MKRFIQRCGLWVGVAFFAASYMAEACTNIIVTGGASVDGSVMVAYTFDSYNHTSLTFIPAGDHASGDSLVIMNEGGEVIGKIPQASHTYAVISDMHEGLMNEHQITIAETTFGGREELENPQSVLTYGGLMLVTLQRAKTAREAIKVIGDIVELYGYREGGEIYTIADPQEVWLLEIIGTGPGGKGAVWVARRIPDGYVTCHANNARIGEFPMNDSENCLYSGNVVSFAVEKGYYNPSSGEPFRFNEAYDPLDNKKKRKNDTRVWRALSRMAPSMKLSPGFHRGVTDAAPYPLWVKPEKKLSLSDMFALIRDHYEGSEYDLTHGIDAGPYNNPNRSRPIDWTIDSVAYAWERPISVPHAAFVTVAQMRSWLPNPIGGVLWYSTDNAYTGCFVPFYCGTQGLPKAYMIGSIQRFSSDSAWWQFNFVSNFANIKYCHMIQDIQKVQGELEGAFIALQPYVESTAVELSKKNPELMTQYLTNYSVTSGEKVLARWRELGEYLIWKYNDGFIANDQGSAESKGYPENWLRTVLEKKEEQLRILPDSDQ